MSFNKEDKYLVINRKDIQWALNAEQKENLYHLANMCNISRELREKTSLVCVVVENTSTNYEKVWGMIEEEYSTQEK